MNTMYYVRHGESVVNITKEFSYRRVDKSLTPRGKLQAEQTADFFSDRHIDAIFASPLKRAAETARVIAERIGKQVVYMEELREVNVGDLELCAPTHENWALYQSVVFEWFGGNKTSAFPNGENYFGLLERFRSSLIRIFDGRYGQNVVVVSHGGILGYTVKSICTEADNELLQDKESQNCSVSVFQAEVQNGKLTCILKEWAKNEHLTGEARNFVSGLPDEFKKR